MHSIVSGPDEGWRREAGTLFRYPFPKDRHFFERKVGRRTHEVISLCRADCPTRHRESTQPDFVTDQRPPSECESLTSFGGAYDGDRVVECSPRARPYVAGTSFQVAKLSTARRGCGAACSASGRAPRQSVHAAATARACTPGPAIRRAVSPRASVAKPRAKTDSGVYAGFHEVGKLHGRMDVYVDVWVLRREIRQSRQQPLRKEESERRHWRWPGAAVSTCLIDGTLQIGERLLTFGRSSTPTEVNSTWRPLRRKRGTRKYSSSACTCMLAALVVRPSASAPRVKLLCSATATKTRKLASGARRYAARGAVGAGER